MAKLTTKARKNLPAVEFAGPNRSYPIPDKTHAESAERLAPRSEKAGNISHATEQRIVATAKAKLASSGATAHPSERISGGSGRDHYKPKR
jgi:hypothetical protein